MWERGGMGRRGSWKEGVGIADYRQVMEEGCKAMGKLVCHGHSAQERKAGDRAWLRG